MTTTETPTAAPPCPEAIVIEGQRGTVPLFAEKDHGLCIAVLDRGFVYFGRCSITLSIAGGSWLIIKNARCVRRWGTERGLAQLAGEGLQPETALDDPCEVQAPMRALILLIPCAEDRWS